MKARITLMGIAGLAVGMLALSGCGGLGGPEDVPSTGALNGIVFDSRNGIPMAGVAISTSPATRAVATNAAGRFGLPACPAGRYTLRATKDGFMDESKEVVIAAGGALESGLVLRPATGAILGRVSTKEGNLPLGGALVRTIPKSMSVLSDANGNFEIESLVPFQYEVIASRSGYDETSVAVVVSAGRQTRAGLQLPALDTAAIRKSVPPVVTVAIDAVPTKRDTASAPVACGNTIACPAGIPSWTLTLPTDPSGLRLTGLASVDDAHAWACGSENMKGVMLRFDPGRGGWVREALPIGMERIGGMQMVSATLGYANAVANNGAGYSLVILRYEGGTWSVFRSKPVSYQGFAWNVQVVTESLIFASYGNEQTVYRITPEGWIDQGIRGKRFSFGKDGRGILSSRIGPLWRFDGIGWGGVEAGTKVWDASMYAAGGAFGLVLSEEGNSVESRGPDMLRTGIILLALDFFERPTRVFALDANHAWIGTSQGAVLFFDGARFVRTVLPGATDIDQISMHAADGGFVLAGNGIYRFH